MEKPIFLKNVKKENKDKLLKYFEIDAEIKALQTQQKEIKQELLESMKGQNIIDEDNGFVYKIETSKSFRTSYNMEKISKIVNLEEFEEKKEIETTSIKRNKLKI